MSEDHLGETDRQKVIDSSRRAGTFQPPAYGETADQPGFSPYSVALLSGSRLSGRANSAVRSSVMQYAQQTHGNHAVQRFVQRGSAAGTVPVQRDDGDDDWELASSSAASAPGTAVGSAGAPSGGLFGITGSDVEGAISGVGSDVRRGIEDASAWTGSALAGGGYQLGKMIGGPIGSGIASLGHSAGVDVRDLGFWAAPGAESAGKAIGGAAGGAWDWLFP